jgi:hypothetical protein
MASQSYELAVHPGGMLTVTLSYPSGPRIVNAISCRYIPVTVQIQGQPRRVVAVEVLHDPANPMPAQPYYCNPELLEKIVLPSQSLQQVKPYEGSGYAPYPGA